MFEIVKVLLQEGIDEETIHEVLNIIEENYEIVDEDFVDDPVKGFQHSLDAKKVNDKIIGGALKRDPKAQTRKLRDLANTIYDDGDKKTAMTLTHHAKRIEDNLNKSKSKGEIERKDETMAKWKRDSGKMAVTSQRKGEGYRQRGYYLDDKPVGDYSPSSGYPNDYNHYKKIGTKAARGHEKESLKGYDGKPNNGWKLYRLGKKVAKRRAQGESYSHNTLLDLLEDLKNSVKKHQPNVKKLHSMQNRHDQHYEIENDYENDDKHEERLRRQGIPAADRTKDNTGKRAKNAYFENGGWYNPDKIRSEEERCHNSDSNRGNIRRNYEPYFAEKQKNEKPKAKSRSYSSPESDHVNRYLNHQETSHDPQYE